MSAWFLNSELSTCSILICLKIIQIPFQIIKGMDKQESDNQGFTVLPLFDCIQVIFTTMIGFLLDYCLVLSSDRQKGG